MNSMPASPKIYHIAHMDRLPSIVADSCLWCDAEIVRRAPPGTTIGMHGIKERRLYELTLTSHASLHVGDCVPFYFCPRSVMLYLIYRGNHHELSYTGGQGPIIHFEADLHAAVAWANAQGRRWAFTLSNAGSYYFEDRCDLAHLDEVDWNAVQATDWRQCKDGKQAEFLLEQSFPWHLVERIGVQSLTAYHATVNALPANGHRPAVEIRPEWYYSREEMSAMIEFRSGDILKSEAEALVNTVNCVGVMGRGIALQFKNAYPGNFKAYVLACKRGEVQPGRMFVFETGQLTPPRYIVNFPTKRHWRGKSRIEDIEAGLAALVDVIGSKGIRSIALPPLGSGLGGLNWQEVRSRIERALGQLADVRVIVFEPKGAPDSDTMVHNREVPTMTAGRAALVELMRRYLDGLLDPFVTLLEVHKLMYFLQEAGEPLRLKYAKGLYGPYAENLRHVLTAIEGHLISGYADGGDAPDKQLQLVPGALEDADVFLGHKQETRSRLAQVSDLVTGFESPFGLELLSTVHWIVSKERAGAAEDVLAGVYAWGDRKRQFTPRQIELALDVLIRKGWVHQGGPGNSVGANS